MIGVGRLGGSNACPSSEPINPPASNQMAWVLVEVLAIWLPSAAIPIWLLILGEDGCWIRVTLLL